jgi:hypothetical protein
VPIYSKYSWDYWNSKRCTTHVMRAATIFYARYDVWNVARYTWVVCCYAWCSLRHIYLRCWCAIFDAPGSSYNQTCRSVSKDFNACTVQRPFQAWYLRDCRNHRCRFYSPPSDL